MTQEEKQLLLKDLCARLPYSVVLDIDTTDWRAPQGHIKLKIEGLGILFKDGSLIVNGSYYGDKYKPYLRPMSNMTEKEMDELESIIFPLVEKDWDGNENPACVRLIDVPKYMNFILSNHFDFIGLIPKGLAIEVTEENNPYK